MLRTMLATAALALVASMAQAAPVRYEFEIISLDPVFGFPDDPVADGFGYVVFDPELLIPESGEGRVEDSTHGLPTIDLSFDWLGQHFDLVTGSLWMVEFYEGVPGYFAIGGRANNSGVPSSAFGGLPPGFTDFELSYLPSGEISAIVALDGIPGFAFGGGTWREASVPEPATLGLLAAGLAGFGVLRRRQMRA